MPTFRVYEVAGDLGVDSKQLIHMLHEMDVRVRSHMSTVTEDQIARLHARLERERRTGAHAAPDSAMGTRRRRRRRQPESVAAEVEAPEVTDQVESDEESLEVEVADFVTALAEADSDVT
ncbi:MAG: translation initiation factor IF-2 N-terminal domain-containing protein, partial [Gemmatimonadetes bacterium]|nr:translation initiation factor IF-2 N-terminal domain-containing protein [Gemmatimonadota bacterium]